MPFLIMRDTIGGRPFEIKNAGGKKTISFFPMNDNAKKPRCNFIQNFT